MENQLREWKKKLDSLADNYSLGTRAYDARMWSLDLIATIMSVCFAVFGMVRNSLSKNRHAEDGFSSFHNSLVIMSNCPFTIWEMRVNITFMA